MRVECFLIFLQCGVRWICGLEGLVLGFAPGSGSGFGFAGLM